MKFSYTVEIQRSPRDVYAYLAEMEKAPRWNTSVSTTRKLTPGPLKVGSRFQHFGFPPERSAQTVEVTTLEPGRKLEVTGALGSFRGRSRFDLTPSGRGTRLTNTVELETPLAMRVVAPLARPRLRAAAAEDLHLLKRALERAPEVQIVAEVA
jgi:uncharacterized protein YndB with AHSA1/START domain